MSYVNKGSEFMESIDWAFLIWTELNWSERARFWGNSGIFGKGLIHILLAFLGRLSVHGLVGERRVRGGSERGSGSNLRNAVHAECAGQEQAGRTKDSKTQQRKANADSEKCRNTARERPSDLWYLICVTVV